MALRGREMNLWLHSVTLPCGSKDIRDNVGLETEGTLALEQEQEREMEEEHHKSNLKNGRWTVNYRKKGP